jgi:hypothetical protein
MIKWDKLLSLKKFYTWNEHVDYWRIDAIESICELYYIQHRNKKKGTHIYRKINRSPNSDYNRFIESHISPLEKYHIWEALFPNVKSTLYASALDEALHLIADTKLIDRVYAGDLIIVKKIIFAIRRKRSKYLNIY